MNREIIELVLIVVVLMIAMRLIFSEIDGKTAVQRMNLAYFLNFENKFTYRKMKTSLITIIICFLLFSGISIFSAQGLLVFAIFVCIGMVADIFSSFVYHYYGRYRFKKRITQAKDYVKQLKARFALPYDEADIYRVEPSAPLTDVIDRYIEERDHVACLSADGGEWFAQLPRYGQVNFLIDRYEAKAQARFTDDHVRVTHLTKDKRYPFKDQKIDVLICYNENFDPKEAKRVVKDEGTVILNQRGSENYIEMYAFSDPRLFQNRWNLELCRQGLVGQHYTILSSDEWRSEIRFRSIGAFYHFVKEQALLKIDRVEDFINQFFFIDQVIARNGFFAMKTHEFYVVARKD